MHMRKGTSIYVKIDEYKDILEIVDLMRKKTKEARATLDRINSLKNEEDSELESWQQSLDEIERKIDFVDKTLFEPE